MYHSQGNREHTVCSDDNVGMDPFLRSKNYRGLVEVHISNLRVQLDDGPQSPGLIQKHFMVIRAMDHTESLSAAYSLHHSVSQTHTTNYGRSAISAIRPPVGSRSVVHHSIAEGCALKP